MNKLNSRTSYQILEINKPLQKVEDELFGPQNSNEVETEVLFSSLNHRDVWITKGLYPNLSFPIIPCSDACILLEDKKYIIQPGFDWGDNPNFQSKNYNILGSPKSGTLTDNMFIARENLFPKPEFLEDSEAATMGLAGLTAYRALVKRANAKSGDNVLITGIGGGVALFALQFAKAIGCKVVVTSSSDEKIKKALELGADYGINYKNENWHKDILKDFGNIDVAVDGASGEGLGKIVEIANPGATIAIYGGTAGTINKINPARIFWKQLNIVGSTMGSNQDFEEMLQLINQHKIRPIVDKIFNFNEVNEAFAYMESGNQFGKITIKIKQ